MGEIREQGEQVWRDHSMDGVVSSDLHEPKKAEIRAWVRTVDVGVAAAQAGLATVSDLAARDAFYAEAANQGKLVYVKNNNGLPDDPANGVYQYSDGAPRIALGFYTGVASVVQPLVDEATAAAASIRTETLNLCPDPFFTASGGVFTTEVGGRRLYSATLPNMAWDGDFEHSFGTGAWIVEASIAATGGVLLWFDGAAVAEGDLIKLAARMRAEAGTSVTAACRFIDDDGVFIGGQLATKVYVAAGGDELVELDPVAAPAGAAGVAFYVADGDPAGDIALIDVLGAKGVSIEALANIEAGQAAMTRALVQSRAEYRPSIALLEAGLFPTPQTIGTESPVDGARLSVDRTYLINISTAYGGYLRGLAVRGRAASEIKIKRFSRVADDFTFRAELVVPIRSGLNVLVGGKDFAEFPIEAGDYLAVFVPSGAIAVTVGARGNTPYYAPLGDVTTDFTAGPLVTTNRIEIGFDLIGGAPAAGDSTAGPPARYSQRLRRFRAFAAAHAGGAVGNRYRLALVGDSWSTGSDYYAGDLAKMLIAKYGDGGVGWFGFGFTSVGPFGDARGLYAATLGGTWTSNYHGGSTSPNISDARSSEAGATITVASVAGATHPALSAAKLHFTGTADGVIRWRWNGGAWSAATAVQGALNGQQALDLIGFPVGALADASVGAITLEIEVVSGSVILGGVDFQSAADGIVLHKLGSSGSKASDWLNSDATEFEAGIALLGFDGAQELFSTNEDAAGQSAATIAASYQDLASRLLTASPSCDLLFGVAPENGLVNGNDMTLYAAAIAALTEGISPDVYAAFCDLQPAFGDPTAKAEYLNGGAIALLDGSNAHPNERGARVVARELALTWMGADA